MTSKHHFPERRRSNRFEVQDGFWAEFYKPRFFGWGKPRIAKSAKIVDISLEGLSFQYEDRDMWSPEFNTLSISKIMGDTAIDNVPFKALSDFSVSRHSSAIPVRRCGAKFGELTAKQKNRLFYFIQNHTISNPPKDRRSLEDRRHLNASENRKIERRENAERRERLQ
jgi:hypothetical protein